RRDLGHGHPLVSPPPRGGGARRGAADLPDRSVEPQDVSGSGALVQTVHVLSHESEGVAAAAPPRQRLVGGIPKRLGHPAPPPPRRRGTPPERVGCRELLRPEALPETARVAERGNTAGGRDARSGQHRDGPRPREPPGELFRRPAQARIRRSAGRRNTVERSTSTNPSFAARRREGSLFASAPQTGSFPCAVM